MSTAHSQRASGEAHLGHVIFISAAAAMGGFLFGYDSAVINGAVTGIQKHFAVGNGTTAFVVAIALLGSAVGAVAAGRLADRGHAERTTGIALVLMLLSWWPVALLHVSLWPLVIGIVVIDFGLQAVHVSNQSLIYQVRPDAQSRLAAAYMLCYCAGSGGGSLASTLVYDRFGWSGVCLLGAVFSALALLVWAVARPRPAPVR